MCGGERRESMHVNCVAVALKECKTVSVINNIEQDWVRLKMRHYPLRAAFWWKKVTGGSCIYLDSV